MKILIQRRSYFVIRITMGSEFDLTFETSDEIVNRSLLHAHVDFSWFKKHYDDRCTDNVILDTRASTEGRNQSSQLWDQFNFPNNLKVDFFKRENLPPTPSFDCPLYWWSASTFIQETLLQQTKPLNSRSDVRQSTANQEALVKDIKNHIGLKCNETLHLTEYYAVPLMVIDTKFTHMALVNFIGIVFVFLLQFCNIVRSVPVMIWWKGYLFIFFIYRFFCFTFFLLTLSLPLTTLRTILSTGQLPYYMTSSVRTLSHYLLPGLVVVP